MGGMEMKKRLKITLWILGILAVLIVVIFIFVGNLLNKVTEEMDSLTINSKAFEEKLHTVDDGTYVGEYYVKGLLGAKIEITIANNKISNIVILDHKNGKGKKAEVIIDDIKNAQSLNVDMITGATYSSKFILKATENSLVK
jgi:uncharacterized protein with FMN-binding domain